VREIGRPDHASTEQLSSLLDDRAEPGDRSFLTGHLDACGACAAELDGIRSVQVLLRGLPVHLPPGNFTIPVAVAQMRPPFQRLIPMTRILGAVAAVLCVAFFAADALQVSNDAPKTFQDNVGTLQITTGAKDSAGYPPVARSEAESAAKPPLAEGRQAAPASGAAADTAAGRSATSSQPAAAAAPGQQPRPSAPIAASPKAPAAAAKPADAAKPAEAQPAAPPPPAAAMAPPTVTVALSATQPAVAATRPPAATSAVVAAPAQAPAGTGAQIVPVQPVPEPMPPGVADSELSPARTASLVLAAAAMALLIASMVLSRIARKSH